MKIRIISAIIALAIVTPLFIMGGVAFNVGVFILSLIATKEMLDIKNTKKEIPAFIKIISYIFVAILMLSNINANGLILNIHYTYVAGLIISFLVPTILYNDREKYSINDAFYLIGCIFFIGTAMLLLVSLRSIRMAIILYLIIIAFATDTFAYITGSLIGKHKMIEKISPKKTWEGAIGGTIFSVFLGSVFYLNVIDPHKSVIVVIAVSTFLSIMGQFGDLIMSAVKRYFNKKDFSNLMPGHGGILDRLDSIIFILLSYMFLFKFI